MMSADKSELSPPSGRAVPEGLAILLLWGGGAVAVFGAWSGLDAGFERAAPILKMLGTKPFGFWTIQFLVESVFGVLAAILGEVLNKVTILGGVVSAVGYYFQTPSGVDAKAESTSKTVVPKTEAPK